MKIIELFEKIDNIDVSFVKDIILDNYNDLLKEYHVSRLANKLTSLFKQYNIAFNAVNEPITRDIRTNVELGLLDAEIKNDGTIIVEITPKILTVLEDDRLLNKFLGHLSATIKHELVHKSQMGKMSDPNLMFIDNPPKKFSQLNQNQKYLADPHEIGAMSHQAVEQLRAESITPMKIIDALKRNDINILSKSNRFEDYYGNFGLDDKFKIFQKFKKLMYQYAESLLPRKE